MMGATERGCHPGDPGHMGGKMEKIEIYISLERISNRTSDAWEAGNIELYTFLERLERHVKLNDKLADTISDRLKKILRLLC